MANKNDKKSAQKKEVDLAWVQKYLRDGVYPPGLSFTEKRMVRKRAERFCFWKEELYYLGTPTDQSLGKKTRKVLLTPKERWEKVAECHVDGEGTHLGLERTAENITAQYHWNGIYRFIKQYIRQCKVCVERNPKMFAKKATTEEVDDGEETDSGGEGQEEEVKVGSKVDLRLLGPYQVTEGDRYILTGVESEFQWVEAFVLDAVSSDTVARSLLQMICRYGQMGSVSTSVHNDQLSLSLNDALVSLKTESDMDVALSFVGPESTTALSDYFKKAEDLIEEFIKKNPTTWPEKIDFCLLPLRMSKQKRQSGSSPAVQRSPKTLSNEEEVNNAAEVLMSVHKGQSKSPLHVSPSKIPSTNVRGIVTRSRTGNTKPKTLDEENYEVPTPKRKASTGGMESPVTRKKIKIDVATPETMVIEAAKEVESSPSDLEIGISHGGSSKKTVDLDDYYVAIKMYLCGDGYPPASSPSFKRLIRDQARNYIVKDGDLYHEVGSKKDLKKIVMSREERLKILAQTHLKSSSKVQMVQSLENYHWKGKLVDCEAFLLACPHCDKVDQNKLKDVAFKNMGEAKRQLLYDRFDTYQEISNYLVYDVFSDDEASKRLEYLQRQIKNFKVENENLVHFTGGKKHEVITSATERQRAVAEAHLRKGTHSDPTNTYHQLADTSFWFGMKFDVKIYVNYCCTAENKHLLDRYFQFREYHMKQPLSQEIASSSEDVITEVPEQNIEVGPVQELAEHTVIEEIPLEENLLASPVKSAGIYVSTLKHEADVETGKPDTEITSEIVTESGDGGNVVTESEDGGTQHTQEAIDGTVIEVPTEEPPTTILVRMTEDGQAIIMREDGSEQSAEMQVDGASEVVTTTSNNTTATNSDDVTSAAVKSILSDTVAIRQLYGDTATEGEQVSETVIEEIQPSEQNIMDTQTELAVAGTVGTAEEGTNTEDVIEEGEDSDSWAYGSEDEDEGDDNEKDHSMLEALMKNSDKKPVTPRQHFKCSQCNKIFYGPLKFKMHMYKHTGQKPFPCNLCNKKYTNKKSLVLHQKIHTGELPFLCSLCGKRCPSKIALKSHLKCHDGNGGGFPAKCDICDRVFSRKHLMERHKLHKHTNLQTEFKCTECNKVFSHQRSLKRHFMSSHLNIKNHVCGLCGKSFYRKEYLTGHLIQHGGAAAEGLTPRKQRPSTFKPRPSVFNVSHELKRLKPDGETDGEEYEEMQDDSREEGVQRIILTQDENGQLRVVDMATEREVKKMLEARGLSRGEAGETMVVHIEEPSGEPQVVHVEHTEEQIVEVPIEEHSYIEYQQVEEEKPREYIISENDGAAASSAQYMYTSSSGEVTIQGNQELIYGQPAVQYEVECVGDVGDEEALSAINLLAQASAQQYESVISQI
ncbi:uncharacterized protein LOC123564788 [Mercenaria mercenaria]|uniref:uncharacterized protein LOC123564788 n=1 Tax=Mercenaria mercenaria TaxID=6596 RepID=UPI00234EB152|nr:uncharacterized protein LOC123564788 [Mercenaria mercenaria]